MTETALPAATPKAGRRRPLIFKGQPLRCTTEFEDLARAEGYPVVAGVDEVGRGALCGPVLAGAVILGDSFDTTGLDDSKRLTCRQRTLTAQRVRSDCRAWSLGRAEASEVDMHGIVQATRMAMMRAVAGLQPRPDLLLVDGNLTDDIGIAHWALLKGDARSVSIAAASIVAKVARDALMQELDAQYPGYGLARNKGYGTLAHLDVLRRLGPSPCHRLSFGGLQMRLFDGC